MQKIINGKRYNTATATRVCDVSEGNYTRSNFRWNDTQLYLTPRGNWFLAGERWRRSCGDLWRYGSGIIAIDEHEARALLEVHGSSDLLEAYFGDQLQDA